MDLDSYYISGDAALIEAAAEVIARTAPIGRAGWKARALVAARVTARSRAIEWRRAEIDVVARMRHNVMMYRGLAALAALNADGEVVLAHGPYGRSHFGSGGAYGSVRLTNAEVSRRGDSGFIAGPTRCRVIDRAQPARVVASGGDCIDDGREWGESYSWVPATQQWVAETPYSRGVSPLFLVRDF